MSGDSRVRALVVDPSPFFREGLCRSLQRAGMVAAQAASLEEAVQEANRSHPLIAFVGPSFAEPVTLAVCQALQSRPPPDEPATKIIVFSACAEDVLCQADAARVGANACVRQDIGEAECLATVTAVLAGHQLFAREILSSAYHLPRLTEREGRILRLLADGRTDGEIAHALGMAASTVHNHTHSILKKLSVHDRCAAVRRARRLGLI